MTDGEHPLTAEQLRDLYVRWCAGERPGVLCFQWGLTRRQFDAAVGYVRERKPPREPKPLKPPTGVKPPNLPPLRRSAPRRHSDEQAAQIILDLAVGRAVRAIAREFGCRP